MLQAYVSSVSNVQRYVASVLMHVAKVDRDVAYVAMVVHVCCKGLLPIFHLCFIDACCKRVYLDVAYVCNGFQMLLGVFFQTFQKHVSSVLSVFKRML